MALARGQGALHPRVHSTAVTWEPQAHPPVKVVCDREEGNQIITIIITTIIVMITITTIIVIITITIIITTIIVTITIIITIIVMITIPTIIVIITITTIIIVIITIPTIIIVIIIVTVMWRRVAAAVKTGLSPRRTHRAKKKIKKMSCSTVDLRGSNVNIG